ncbi:MarR family winged helix-turn-helix transcriptional regulator [Pseudoramibacter alactolyticus]
MNAFEKPLDEIYRKLKLYFYREMALHTNREDNGLSITESFCMESIYALDHPTIAQFANFMNISSPNATYKIHHLIAKGYLEKIQSPKDKREYYLQPTEKYMRYHAMNRSGYDETMKRIGEHFPTHELEKLNELLTTINEELVKPFPAK